MSVQITMRAPSNINPGSTVLFPDGTKGVVDVNGNIAVNATGLFIDYLLNAGFTIVLPNYQSTFFGGLAQAANFGTFKDEGNLYRIAGFPLGANKADTTDDILCGIALDAGAFDQAGRGLAITCQGTTGATTNNKRFKLWINPTISGATIVGGIYSNAGTVTAGTPVVDSGTWLNATTPNNAAGWSIFANIFKYGAAGSNTQYGQGSPIEGTLHGGIQAAQQLTLTESGIINIVVTGSSYTTGAANDVLAQFFEVNAMN